MEGQAEELKKRFLAWQCLLRQRAMRVGGGKPTSGMRPKLSIADGGNYSDPVTVLLLHLDAAPDAAQFRHMALKTHDPADRYSAAVKYLSAAYYQSPQGFSDEMTALFSASGLLAQALRARRSCILEFSQFGSRYKMECAIRELEKGSVPYEATYWHNKLFNSRLPAEIAILGFTPQWSDAVFDETPSER
ncbi:MAG: hypothetical protein CL395_08950 [Acidiferrobacteraceae bacterium]|jgi:hypothetical protein|nr:hypothetical protein [Acidiferrobacteraceae bacterium]HJP07842.1 hypothetical protein [Arenicellales bacterium]|tara:strand:- start:10629 stop:11198 length:570 start_codon:yes stop_codon:yes gene_type:complete